MVKLIAVRGGDPPDPRAVVIRGGAGGLSAETVRRAATRSRHEYGLLGVSVFVAREDDVLHVCGSDPLGRYRQIRSSRVARLLSSGFALLASGREPHFDIVLADLEDDTLIRLDLCFDPPVVNPARGD